MAWVASQLGNVKGVYRVDDPLWNHSAHLFSSNANKLVYDKFIPLLPSSPI